MRKFFPCLVLSFFTTSILCAQDTVFTSTATDPAARIKRQGQILDYTGTELTLKTTFGTTERIPAGRVIDIQTTWVPSHQAGTAARAEGKLDDAISAFREAKREEKRPWAQRRIMAELSGAYLEAGQIAGAVGEFLTIASSDPATIHFDVIPIAWRAAPPDAALEAHAAQWLAAEKLPPARLLGASWLLSTGQRAAATAALEELAKSDDQRIAGLAAIQLWRTKLVTAKPAEIGRWQTQLEKLPPEIQAAGWYILGDLFSRQEQPEQAALAYLKVPLLFRQQRAMAANALLAAGKQLEKMGQATGAATLYRELLRDFAHVPAATEGQSRLDALAPKPATPKDGIPNRPPKRNSACLEPLSSLRPWRSWC
jgi:tetratricopeptide (TPR) repeat protein